MLGFSPFCYEQNISLCLELLSYLFIFSMTVHLCFAATCDIFFNFNICSHHVCVNGLSKRRYGDDRAKLLIVADGMMRESDIKLQCGQFRLDTKEKSLH